MSETTVITEQTYAVVAVLVISTIRKDEYMKTIELSTYTLLFSEYPDVVGIVQLCEMLGGICQKTAYRLLATKKIQPFKIGNVYKIPKINVIKYVLQESILENDNLEPESSRC